MSKTWIITGANRGIGLEYVKQLLASGENVIAAVRDPAKAEALLSLSENHKENLRVKPLDLNSWSSIDSFAESLKGTVVDVLLNNAGLYGGSWDTASHKQSIDSMDYELWGEIMRVNVMAPFRLIRALDASLQLSENPIVVNMSSDLGSIENNEQGQSYAYRSSKAALNMVTKGLSIELQEQGTRIISMAPGWTQTDLGGVNAQWKVEDSVANQIKAISSLKDTDSGLFINLLGEKVPW